MAVVDVCAVVDPERVVLDGTVGRALAPRIPQLAGLVAASLPHPPVIAVSELAPSAVLAGGIAEARRLLGGGPAGVG
jgi:glucokinase